MSDQQAFLEGYADVLRRYAFIAGYLEALVEMDLDVVAATEVLLDIIESVQLWVVEDVVEPAGEVPCLYCSETYFIREMSGLSPPEVSCAA